MNEVEIERLARLILIALRRSSKRALIMGGGSDLTYVTIDGTFDLIKVAKVLRERAQRTGGATLWGQ